MASKKNKSVVPETNNSKSSTDYYKLKTKAIDDLINANEENSPEVTPEDLKQYSSPSKFKLSEWAKAVLIKLWFAGAVCFFVFWGLGTYITASLDMMFVFGIALGIVTDLLVNNIFRFYAKTPGANDRWLMFPKKNFINFFFNILYAFVLLTAVYMLYNIINGVIVSITGNTDTVPFGVEPIGFGTFYMMFDMLFIGMKRLFKKIVDDAKKSAK